MLLLWGRGNFFRFFEIYNRFTSLSLKKSASLLLELESKISDIFGIQWKPVARLATGFHWRNKDHMRHLLSTWLLKTKRNHFHAMNATTNVLVNLIWRFTWEDTQGCAPSYNLGDKLLLPNVMVWTNTKRFFTYFADFSWFLEIFTGSLNIASKIKFLSLLIAFYV